MKPTQKIQSIKSDLEFMFGKDDSVIRALELKERYLEIGTEFNRLRENGTGYEQALREVSDLFYQSESTCKRAIACTDQVQNFELTNL